MQRDNRPPRLLAIIALALGIGACKRVASEHPDRPAKPGRHDDRGPSDAAKASFAQVAERYAAAKARGRLVKAGCDELAQAFLRVYDEYGPSMAIAKFNAGAVREECGAVDDAATIYLQLTREAPKFALSYNNLGVIHWNRGEESKALEFFKRAVEADAATTAPRNNLAAALRERYSDRPEQQLFRSAELEIQSVLALDSGNQLAYEHLARLYYDRGRLEDKSYLLLADLVVTQALAKAKDGSLRTSPDIHNIKGLLLMQQDNQIDALAAFKRAVDIDAKHADAHMNIALIAIRFRDYSTAESSLGVALADRRQKENVEAYLGLGVAQRGLRKYTAAEKSFKKAIAVRRSDPRALYNLGILYHDHIGPDGERKNKTERFDKRPYETAKRYFQEFVAKSSGNTSLSKSAADAKQRMANIENYFIDVEQMQRLQIEADRLAEQEREQEELEKERLRKLENQLKAGS